MTHDWMSGPIKFLLSAPVRLAFWSIYGQLLSSIFIVYWKQVDWLFVCLVVFFIFLYACHHLECLSLCAFVCLCSFVLSVCNHTSSVTVCFSLWLGEECRSFSCCVFPAGVDTAVAIYTRYTHPEGSRVAYVAHFAGLVAGNLFIKWLFILSELIDLRIYSVVAYFIMQSSTFLRPTLSKYFFHINLSLSYTNAIFGLSDVSYSSIKWIQAESK